MKHFKCKKCDGEVLEEVLLDAVIYITVRGCKEDGELDYGKKHIDDGQVSHYQCGCCGTDLEFDNGDRVTKPDDMANYLKEYGIE